MDFDIYMYTDYRKALHDYYQGMKCVNRNFSYRYIAQKVGFSSGFFAHILSGKSNIKDEKVEKFSELLRLSHDESQYFRMLVKFNQEKDHGLKKVHFEDLIKLLKHNEVSLSVDLYDFYNHWYYSAIREATDYLQIDTNYLELANHLYPRISEEDAKKAVELLLRLELVEYGDDGFLKKTDALIKTGDEQYAFMLNNFAYNMMQLAQQSICGIEKEFRHISWLTFNISSQRYKEFVHEIREFRLKLVSLASLDTDPSVTYQMNMQFFPITNYKDTP